MQIINVPNILTATRIVVIPFLSVVIIGGRYFYGLLLFTAASFTDFIDGYIARRFNKITPFGTCFDPLADKLFFLSALSVLTIKKEIPLWFTLFILLRDFTVAIGSLIAIYKNGALSIKPHIIGKAVNLLLFLIIIIKLLSLSGYFEHSETLIYLLYLITILLSSSSFFIYLFRYLKEGVFQSKSVSKNS